jgi:HPt (histidine-containing phosphotransfer) domain-containing protein
MLQDDEPFRPFLVASSMKTDYERPPFNRLTALSRIGGDEQLLHDLATFYVEDAPQLLDKLNTALQLGDAEGVLHAAHTLKSLSANLDAHQAVAVAEIVEHGGRTGELTVAATLIPELEAAIAAVIGSLRETYHDLPEDAPQPRSGGQR